MTFEAACMTPEERALYGGCRVPPCADCPLAFAADMRLQNRCNGSPRIALPAPKPQPTRPPLRMWPVRYDSDAERLEARRRTWRDSKRRVRAAIPTVRSVTIDGAGDGCESNTLRAGARSSAITRERASLVVSEVMAQ